MKRYTEEEKKAILEFANNNTIALACQQFSVSKYAINQWKGWTRKNAKETHRKWFESKGKEYYSRPYVRVKARAAAASWKKRNPDKAKTYGKKSKWSQCFALLAYYSNRSCERKKIQNYNELKPFDVWRIAKRQRLICALTGLRLHRGNISLDHIIPTSQGGANTIDNLQIVHRWANIAKYDLEQDVFLDFCYLVAQNNPRNPDADELAEISFINKNQHTGLAAASMSRAS